MKNMFNEAIIANTEDVKGGTFICLPVRPLPNICPTPAVNFPKFEFPKIEFPKIEFPKIEFPKIEIPKFEFPKIGFPTIHPPFTGINCPKK